MKAIFIVLFLLPLSVWARPKHVEFWFLKEPVVAHLQDYIHEMNVPKFSKLFAFNDRFECVPMGDGCFHPQLGFVNKNPMDAQKEIKDKLEEKKAESIDVQVNTINSETTESIECDKNNFFDMFCGEAQKNREPASFPLEVWIDVSSSFNNVDYSKDSVSCFRRKFVNKLFQDCGREKVNISVFNTVKKDLGALDTLCINYGTNNMKRAIDWIEASTAKRLIVITDISEVGAELSEYLDSIGAVTKGVGAKDFLAKMMMDESKRVAGFCK